MSAKRRLARAGKALILDGVLLIAVSILLAGCTPPKITWSQRVILNGRSFTFSRIDSLGEGSGGHQIEYKDGDFIVKGQGPIAVNGFEVFAEGKKVVLANHHLELEPGEEVHFSSDMNWKVKPGPAQPPEAKASVPGGEAAEKAPTPEKAAGEGELGAPAKSP